MDYKIKEDGKFKYLEEGEGEVIVLLHGLFGALSNFKDLFEHFKSKYKVVIPMLPLYDMPVATTGVKSLAKLTGAKVIGKSPPDDQDHDQTFKPNREINDGDIINIEDIEIMAIETPGHASNHVCFFSKNHKALFSGDHLMNGSSVLINPPDGDMQNYINSLKKIESLEMKYIAPAHGAIFDNPYETIKQTLLHRLSREARIIKSLKNNPKSNLSNLVKYVYDDVDQSIHFIAERSLLAHLVKLEKEGIVNNEDDFWDLN